MFALCLTFGPFPASTPVVAPPYFFGHYVPFQDDGPCFFRRDRCAVHVSEFIGTVFEQDDPYPIEQVSGTGTHGLVVVLAFVDHLVVIDGRDLRVPLTGDVSVPGSACH